MDFRLTIFDFEFEDDRSSIYRHAAEQLLIQHQR